VRGAAAAAAASSGTGCRAWSAALRTGCQQFRAGPMQEMPEEECAGTSTGARQGLCCKYGWAVARGEHRVCVDKAPSPHEVHTAHA